MRDRDSISKNKEYNTPPKIIDAIKEFLGGSISLDPCSNKFSHVHADTEWILPTDGLQQDWTQYRSIFVNPPYGRDIERGTSIRYWCRKCRDTYLANPESHIFLLIPVATNTRHWKEYIFPSASHICFLYDTRVKFWEKGEENKKGSPMPCCIVHYGKRCYGRSFMDSFNKLGVCIRLWREGTVTLLNSEEME